MWDTVLHLRRQRSDDENDHQRKKSNDETRVQKPQSCVTLIAWQNQLGPQGPNQICWHQKPLRWLALQRKLLAWWTRSPSSFVQHHEFLDLFLQPISFHWKDEHHVEERWGKKHRRRACGSETVTDIFDFKKPRQTASLDSGASNVPGNPDLDSISVPGSTGTLVRDRVKNPATSSQEWQKDNPCPGSTRKLVQSGPCERSGSIGEQVQGVEIQLARTRLDFYNVQISDCQFVEKVFEKIRQKLRRSSYELDAKTNVSIWRLLMSTTMKASVDFGFHYNENFAAYRNTNFKELKTLFYITPRSILEQSLETLNVSTTMWRFVPWMWFTLCHTKL